MKIVNRIHENLRSLEELTSLNKKLNPFILNLRNLAYFSELLQNGSGTMHVMDEPTTVSPRSAISVFLTTTNLTIFTISFL